MNDFYTKVKSTIDRLAVDIANDLGIGFVEMDDTVNVDEMLASDQDLIVYQMVTMVENPIDPMWDMSFNIGAKTTTDAANYDLAGIVSKITDYVAKNSFINVMDYSGIQAPTDKEGYIHFVDVAIDPQAFDGASGVRMFSVQSKAVRTQ